MKTHKSFYEFVKEEQDWIESVISFDEDSNLTQDIIKTLQEHGVDTGSFKSSFNADTKKREIRVFNKRVEDLELIFKADKYSGLSIKKYEE